MTSSAGSWRNQTRRRTSRTDQRVRRPPCVRDVRNPNMMASQWTRRDRARATSSQLAALGSHGGRSESSFIDQFVGMAQKGARASATIRRSVRRACCALPTRFSPSSNRSVHDEPRHSDSTADARSASCKRGVLHRTRVAVALSTTAPVRTRAGARQPPTSTRIKQVECHAVQNSKKIDVKQGTGAEAVYRQAGARALHRVALRPGEAGKQGHASSTARATAGVPFGFLLGGGRSSRAGTKASSA